MPSLGADMETGTLVEWCIAVGDHVSKGDTVAVVDTDKATIDVEVFETGVVTELLVEPGASVPVGAPLAVIGAADEGESATHAGDAPGTGASHPTPSVPPEQPANTPTTTIVGGPGRHHASVVLSPVVRHLADRLGVDTGRLEGHGPGGRVTRHDVENAARTRVSPRARRMAAASGVDPSRLVGPGSGPGGAVVARDIEATSAAVPHVAEGSAPSGATVQTGKTATTAPSAGGRSTPQQAMARTMERSNREIPHFHVASTIDLEPAMAFLGELNRVRPSGARVLPAAVLLRAVAAASRAVPDVNGWWRDGAPVAAPTVAIGMVVSLRGGGLLTPTLTDPDRCTLDELMDRLRGTVQRARRGSLRSSDIEPATLTVTNLGERGAEVVHGVIQPPQLALVGFGRIVERPWVHGGEVVPRRVVTASLAADHRAVEGHVASRFMSRLERELLDPAALCADRRPGNDDHDPHRPGVEHDGP